MPIPKHIAVLQARADSPDEQVSLAAALELSKIAARQEARKAKNRDVELEISAAVLEAEDRVSDLEIQLEEANQTIADLKTKALTAELQIDVAEQLAAEKKAHEVTRGQLRAAEQQLALGHLPPAERISRIYEAAHPVARSYGAKADAIIAQCEREAAAAKAAGVPLANAAGVPSWRDPSEGPLFIPPAPELSLEEHVARQQAAKHAEHACNLADDYNRTQQAITDRLVSIIEQRKACQEVSTADEAFVEIQRRHREEFGNV